MSDLFLFLEPTILTCKRGRIIWTIEWIGADRSRSLSSESEIVRLEEAYNNHVKQGKKRKRTVQLDEHQQVAEIKEEVHNVPTASNEHIGVSSTGEEATPTTSGRGLSPRHEPRRDGPVAIDGRKSSHVKVEGVPDASNDVDDTESEPVPSQYNYFLLRPRTSSSRHVLIPLSRSATLAECLRGRTVLAFPTIYVFPTSNTELPKDCILEEEYLREQGEDQKELEQLLKEVDPSTLR